MRSQGANIGGALSPLGDPPLFVGFLRGVDFFWTTRHLWFETALVAVIVLAVFVALDVLHYRKDRLIATVGEGKRPMNIGVSGSINLLLIAGIITAILAAAAWKPATSVDAYGTRLELQNVARDAALVLIAILSLVLTPNEHREANEFSWEPIAEVAILFAGIFICIIPVLAMLDAGADGAFAWLLAALIGPDDSARDRLFLADRGSFGLSRQRADLSRVLRARRRRRPRADGAACANARRDLHGRGLHGRHDLYRQRAEFYDLYYRGGARDQDAELFRLHALVSRGAAAGFYPAHFRLTREGRLTARAVRPLLPALDAEADFDRAAVGNAATASISMSAPSRARPEMAMVVLAGRLSAAR